MSFNKDLRLLQQLLAEAEERKLKEQQKNTAENKTEQEAEKPANWEEFNAQETEGTLTERAYKLSEEENKKATETLNA